MSEQQPTIELRTAAPGPIATARAGGPAPVEVNRTIELPADVVDEIAARADAGDVESLHDLAHEYVEQRVEFHTPDGRPIEDAVGAE